MPDGIVQWVDASSGSAAIIRGSRVYAASWTDVEPVARHAGARVHFDIRRDHGAERAVDVRLRAGSRASPHHRRVGTLAGARRSDTKGDAPFARPHPERGRALAAHPLEVAMVWARCLGERDLDAALSFYRSDAVVHAGADEHTGRRRLGPYLEASPMFGTGSVPEVRGDGDMVVVRWPAVADVAVEVRSRIEHGLIAEQWVLPAPEEGHAVEVVAGGAPMSVAVLTRGVVSDDDVDYAVQRIAGVLGRIDDRILFARITLDRAGDPARVRPALAKVTLDVNGELVRAHVAAQTVREAADLLQRRLADQLQHRAQHLHDLRTRGAERRVGEWRHGDLPSARPDLADRPRDERQLVRHKTFAFDELTVDEAAFDLEQLDYDFYLFRDLAGGGDAVIERREADGYRLTRLHPIGAESGPAAVAVTVAGSAPPALSVAEAIERLDADGERFVFFANTATGRGNVVYRRYDGHYGLVTPAEEAERHGHHQSPAHRGTAGGDDGRTG